MRRFQGLFCLTNLAVGDAKVALRFWRIGERTDWEVTHQHGELNVYKLRSCTPFRIKAEPLFSFCSRSQAEPGNQDWRASASLSLESEVQDVSKESDE